MKPIKRRQFHKIALGTTAALSLPYSNVLGANDDIRVAVVGFRSQGRSHINNYLQIPGVRVVALCDVDRHVLERGVNDFKKRNLKVDAYTDIRKLLEDDSIDAVSTATPNHWHALITVWSCQAGKHVCVEKPVSHNIFESRQMVNAARKYNRLVQADLDLRSQPWLQEAVQFVHEGNLGKPIYARIHNYKKRGSIGKVNGPQEVPDHIDYNLWTGPAPMHPLRRQRLHYDWHWVWETGNGEIGNNGPHQLDICRWMLGCDTLPKHVLSLGGRFGYDDDGETPNTHLAYFDYQPAPIYYESRGLPRKAGHDWMDAFHAQSITGTSIKNKHQSGSPNMGWLIQCENGYLLYGQAFSNDGTLIKSFKSERKSPQASFIQALQSGKRSDLRSDILEGHLSTSLSHLGNISYRVGSGKNGEEIRERLQNNKRMLSIYEQMLDHLIANQVNLKQNPIQMGVGLTFDPEAELFTGEFSNEANQLVSRHYRKPFVVHEMA